MGRQGRVGRGGGGVKKGKTEKKKKKGEDEEKGRRNDVNLVLSSIESDSLDDGHHYAPKSLFSWLTRVMYNRRTRINPLWNTLIVGGYDEETP